MAVVSSYSDTSFAQQGSLDWVALSNMPFHASIAVLGQLSGAGLEPLTVAVAQAVCSKLPIGAQGEQRLSEAMSTFKMYGSFGDVVWFGVGVRHILRTLVQTSQGASSIALTAALAEGFSSHVATLVLYELPKCFGSPSELTPSFAQWERYIQLCSGIFATSGFGWKIAQLAKILGFTNRNNPAHWRASEAKDIAKFLRGVSEILNGQTESMEVTGGMTCSWAVILCDHLFGLRVQLGKFSVEDSGVVFQNYDSTKETYQIRFSVVSTSPGRELSKTRATFSLLPAELKLIHRQQHSHYSRHSLDWRIPQDAVLKDFFGHYTCQRLDQISAELSKLFGSFALLYHWSPYSRFYRRYTSATELLHRLAACLTEMEQWVPDAEECMKTILEDWEHTNGQKWEAALSEILNFSRRSRREREEHTLVESTFATPCYNGLRRISEISDDMNADVCCTLLLLAVALADVILDDPLELRRGGLARFYAAIENFREKGDDFAIYDSNFASGFRFCRLVKQCLWLYTEDFRSSEDTMFRAEHREFGDVIAASAYGVYCHMEYLKDPFQSHVAACKVHVGRGSIEANGRLYSHILDQDGDDILPYSANVTSDFPKKMAARLMIEESTSLKLWFEQWDGDSIEERQAVIPGEALQAGWYGSKGFWRGPFGSLEDPKDLD